jgi:hypothetical protein
MHHYTIQQRLNTKLKYHTDGFIITGMSSQGSNVHPEQNLNHGQNEQVFVSLFNIFKVNG